MCFDECLCLGISILLILGLLDNVVSDANLIPSGSDQREQMRPGAHVIDTGGL